MTRSLLFLPGAGADPGFWKPLGDRLPGHWSKTYLGWPGLGDQPASAAVRGFADMVAMVERSVTDAPVDLLAQSMGGAVALQVALNHPARVRRIVLAATSGGLDVAGLGGVGWRDDYARDYPGAALSILDNWPDLTASLSRVCQPTLLLWGDSDPISPVAVGRALAALLPDARLEIVAGGDHAFVSNRPEDIAASVAGHLA